MACTLHQAGTIHPARLSPTSDGHLHGCSQTPEAAPNILPRIQTLLQSRTLQWRAKAEEVDRQRLKAGTAQAYPNSGGCLLTAAPGWCITAPTPPETVHPPPPQRIETEHNQPPFRAEGLIGLSEHGHWLTRELKDVSQDQPLQALPPERQLLWSQQQIAPFMGTPLAYIRRQRQAAWAGPNAHHVPNPEIR